MWVQPIKLMPDELLSSWLVRAAFLMGCDPIVLSNAIWPQWRAWTVDFDRSLSPAHFTQLQKYSDLSGESITNSLLWPIERQISGDLTLSSAVWPWILALGIRNRKRRVGPQFCPACYASSKNPYLSRFMRCAWHTGCEIHGLQLLDRCQVCDCPLEPHRLTVEDGSLTICASCHADLSLQLSPAHSPLALRFQRAVDALILNKGGYFFGVFVSVPEWFQLADYCIALVRRSTHPHFHRLAVILSELGVNQGELLNTDLGLELLSTKERIALIERVWILSQHTLDAVESLLMRCDCSQEMMSLSNEIQVPRILSPFVQTLPINKLSKRQVQGPRTSVRSKYMVEKMMARLVRKLRISTR